MSSKCLMLCYVQLSLSRSNHFFPMLHVYNFVLLVCLAEMLGFHILYVLCSYVMIGRSFFSVSLGTGRLADGVEFWRGYYQSIRPTQMGLSLNIGILLPFHFPFLLTPCH